LARPPKKIPVKAEENLVLYATGSKKKPCLSLYDAGEGQLAKDFPTTFCSLIFGDKKGSYKGAIPFVQGRFNMGSSGALTFSGETRKLQLIVSRVPNEVAKTTDHEWAFTILCFFPCKHNPSWKYLIGEDENALTAGTDSLGLLPKKNAKSGELLSPRERKVESGTLVKMYDYKAPLSNICGELYKKIEDHLISPALPLRIIECRSDYQAKVMGNNVWDSLEKWKSKGKLEQEFEDGSSISIPLSTGETIPAEIRVFKSKNSAIDEDQPQTGLRALINGQSHAKRDARFFRTPKVDKEHIAGSILVMLDCSELGQQSRNAILASNRETFREDPLLTELIQKLQKVLKAHEGLRVLNLKRYEEKLKNAVDDEDGINALEELLSTDPELADLFGSMLPGKVAAKTAKANKGKKVPGEPQPFVGEEFPSYFHRADKSTSISIELPCKGSVSTSFGTDVKNDYFTRHKHRGKIAYSGDFQPTANLFKGKLTLTFMHEKTMKEGDAFTTELLITDNKGSGPFTLKINGTVVAQPEEHKKKYKKKNNKPEPKAYAEPSRPDIKEVNAGPEAPPLTIGKIPDTDRLQLLLNKESQFLIDAKNLRPQEEAAAVDFVFKYGLALAAMGLLDASKKTPEWKDDDAGCRKEIGKTVAGIARVIVPLCLSLPNKLPVTTKK
jgi:hypothetical protein